MRNTKETKQQSVESNQFGNILNCLLPLPTAYYDGVPSPQTGSGNTALSADDRRR